MPSKIKLAARLIAALAAIGIGGLANASEPVSIKAVESYKRVFGFVNETKSTDTFQIAVVYGGNTRDMAAQVSRHLDAAAGPKRTKLSARPYSFAELTASNASFDAVVLLSSSLAAGEKLAQFIREQRVLSISSDRGCLEISICTIMINTDNKVEIVLDTQLAESTGIQFSSVFTMMVTRQ